MGIHLKALLFLLFFSLLHLGYDLTNCSFLAPFCGTNESVFQHLKMAFWGYGLLTVAEYFVVRSKFSQAFWYSRILSIVMVPWVAFLMWYLLPAVHGRAESLALELTWAIAITYLSGLLVAQIEKDTEKVRFSLPSRLVLLSLFFVSAFLLVLFTYRLPWIDLFVDPAAL